MSSRRRSTIKLARARALAEIATWPRWRATGLRLDGDAYSVLRGHGLSQQDVTSAVDLLCDEGLATVDVERGTIVIRLTGEGTP